MLRVYYAELPEAFSCGEEQLLLSSYREEKLRRTASPQTRRQRRAAELLLQRAACAVTPDLSLPLDIRTRESGKPFFPSLPFAFSLSHSGPFVACAIADHEIGLDVQARSKAHEPLLRRCFSKEERQFVEESEDRDAAFTEIWCLKESYLKATGEGISRSMSGFSLDFREPLSLIGSDTVRFWRFGDARFRMAVCSLDGNEPVPERIEKTELRL